MPLWRGSISLRRGFLADGWTHGVVKGAEKFESATSPCFLAVDSRIFLLDEEGFKEL